ncbi:hypothetical protein [Streptomyces sp. NBC_00631]|uniref:hypothetical protein n=1 Tax=Streptomyces sp. NBC_00631 TaxID=2975793 RepID=UPI00386E5E50
MTKSSLRVHRTSRGPAPSVPAEWTGLGAGPVIGEAVVFATWQAYALGHGEPCLLWSFLVVEAAFGVARLWPGRWTPRTRRPPGTAWSPQRCAKGRCVRDRTVAR